MKEIQGIWWPDTVGEKWIHTLKHVHSLDWALGRCAQYRTAIQAGGNMGLWPRKMAERFERVWTFEPDTASRECLVKNVPKNVTVKMEALGHYFGSCQVIHKSLGSHRVFEGNGVDVVPLDSFNFGDVDLLQLDIEGYEWHALMGAEWTIATGRPVIQLEMRNYSTKYGHSDADILALLARWNYVEASRQAGSDVVFLPKERA
jgi:FkbM family methyltransferase